MLDYIGVISIHPPRAGWDGTPCAWRSAEPAFQSTHPVRGGTPAVTVTGPDKSNFNPPTPCGVGLEARQARRFEVVFQSTHPVRGGTIQRALLVTAIQFQSTHPVRGGTMPDAGGGGCGCISIHPPRAGWDGVQSSNVVFVHEISIHPPRAGWDGPVSCPASYFC